VTYCSHKRLKDCISLSSCLELVIRVFALSLAFCSATLLSAQSASSIPSQIPPQKPQAALSSHPDWPKANPADVATIEDTVRAFFSAISAPAGGKLDRNRLRSLFVPGGRIVLSREPRTSRPADVTFLSPDEYANLSDGYTATAGFFDRNLANQVEKFGVMAHVYSTYESRSHPEDAKPMVRGVKSIDLLNSANRWYIVEVYWDTERPDNPIPNRYMHDSVR
jgi:hypothetical protein